MVIHCLLVEDEFFTRDVISLTLRRAQISVDVVDNGKEALQYLKSNQPDALIVDLHMPGINGYDLINMVRDDDILKNIVIIVITANPSAISTPEAQMADAFFSKPLDIKRMVETIRRLASVEQS